MSDFHFSQNGAFLCIVLPPENLPFGDLLPLASAKFDDAPPLQRNDLRPLNRLDGPRRVNDFRYGRDPRQGDVYVRRSAKIIEIRRPAQTGHDNDRNDAA